VKDLDDALSLRRKITGEYVTSRRRKPEAGEKRELWGG